MPVAGGVRAGVFRGDPNRTVDPRRLRVEVGRSGFSRLCVDLRSRDARYEARLEYDVETVEPGIYLLEFPTRRMEELRSYRSRELAVLAYFTRERCPGPVVAIAPIRWGRPRGGRELTVLVSSGGMDVSLSVPKDNGRDLRIPCVPVKAGRVRTAYDTECRLPAEETLRLEEIRILRRNFENHLPPVALPLVPR